MPRLWKMLEVERGEDAHGPVQPGYTYAARGRDGGKYFVRKSSGAGARTGTANGSGSASTSEREWAREYRGYRGGWRR